MRALFIGSLLIPALAAAAPAGSLRVVVPEGWADVRVDGRAVGRSPVELRLPPGDYRVELPATRFHEPWAGEVRLPEGAALILSVVRELRPVRVEPSCAGPCVVRVDGVDREPRDGWVEVRGLGRHRVELRGQDGALLAVDDFDLCLDPDRCALPGAARRLEPAP